MKIDTVSNAPDRSGRYRVVLQDGSILRLYRQTMQDFGIYPGLELTDKEFSQLQDSASEMSAKMRAVRIVAATSVSEKDLEHRLVQKGEDPKQAQAAVAWMRELSVLDDSKTAEQVVTRCISRGYGLSRAKQALYEKRIPKEYWSDALENYPDQIDKIVDFLKSRLKGNFGKNEVRRAIDALLRRGHSYEKIRLALRSVDLGTDDFSED